MSQISDAKTYGDLLHLFDALGVILNSSCIKLAYPNIDARHVALGGIQQIVAGYAMGFSSMIHSRTQDQIIASFGKSNLSSDEMRRCVEVAWKNGLLTLCHFKLDSLLQNLLRALGAYDRRARGFSDMSKRIIAIASPRNADHCREFLILTGYLRNTFHNNGIHRGPPMTITLQDMQFDLQTDKPLPHEQCKFGHIPPPMTPALAVHYASRARRRT